MKNRKLLRSAAGFIITTICFPLVAATANNEFNIPSSSSLSQASLVQIKNDINFKKSSRMNKSSVDNGTIAQTKTEIINAISGSVLRKTNEQNRKTPLISEAQQINLKKLSRNSNGSVSVNAFFDKKSGVPRFVKLSQKEVVNSSSPLQQINTSERIHDFLSSNRDLLKLSSPREELNLIDERKDELGRVHYKYQQMHNGIPIFGRELIVHSDKVSNIYLLNGHTQPTPVSVNSGQTITSSDAINITRKHLKIDSGSGVTSSLVFRSDDNNNLDLVYMVDIMPTMADRWLYFVSAGTGDVIHKIHNIQHIGTIVNASDLDLLGQTRSFSAWSENASYYMIDPSTPLFDSNYDPLTLGPNLFGDTFVYDANNSDGTSLVLSTSSNLNTSWDAAAVSAMFNTKAVYDYYLQKHNRNSIDNNNLNLLTLIHFKTDYNNAFWNGSFMVYGDGDNITFTSLAGCLDVAGHEMTHGVIENTAGLIYENQSGALNESFADVMGVMIDDNDWTIAEDCTLPSPGYLRNMKNPALGLSSQPTKMSEYQNLPNTSNGDNGGVHINSGIPNRAAYLLAEGLTTEGFGTSIGRAKTEKIYYRALTIYLTASSQFIDARRALIQSAEDLYGAGSAESVAVGLAWDAVEVIEGGLASPNNTSPTQTDKISGVDSMVYLYPQDGSHDSRNELFNLYRQVMDVPFTGYNPINDYGPLNIGIDAAYTKPAAYTDADVNLILFVGVDNNLYMVSDVVNPIAADVTQITTTNDIYSIAISPDGRYFAYTSTLATDNSIHLIDLIDSANFDIPLISQNYQDGQSQTVDTIFYADSLSFDYTSNEIVFDALFCQSLPTSTCDLSGGGYQYWSIGIVSLDTRSVRYPVPNQGLEFDIGFPAFASNNNFVIVLDVNEYTASGVYSSAITGNLETSDVSIVADFGLAANGFLSVPSFWGGDDYITTQVPVATAEAITAYGVPIDTNWAGNTALATRLNNYAVAMPVMHREGQRILTGSLQTSSSLLDFGILESGATKELDLTLSNIGNSDVEIGDIILTGSGFSHNATNIVIPRQSSITVRISYSPTVTSGTQIGSLVFHNNGVITELNISLTAVVDNIAPVITLIGSSQVNLNVGEAYTDPGATAIDNIDGNVNVSVSGAVNINNTGTYILTYSATDTAGNSSTKTRTVNISATQPASSGGGGGGSLSWLTLFIISILLSLTSHERYLRSMHNYKL